MQILRGKIAEIELSHIGQINTLKEKVKCKVTWTFPWIWNLRTRFLGVAIFSHHAPIPTKSSPVFRGLNLTCLQFVNFDRVATRSCYCSGCIWWNVCSYTRLLRQEKTLWRRWWRGKHTLIHMYFLLAGLPNLYGQVLLSRFWHLKGHSFLLDILFSCLVIRHGDHILVHLALW